MNVTDKSALRGDLRITVRSAITGASIRRLLIKNTITQKALTAIIRLLAQPTDITLTNYQMTSLHIGTGTAAPTKTQTALSTEVLSLPLAEENRIITDSDPFELKILITLGADQGNGNTLTEAGLFLTNNFMFSRQTHPALVKTSALVFDYDWRIEFTA